ncbi:LysM domain containing protein [Klebsormidium nitens]|uniref:LysM domain containing protein n=1 Tax=Klebsormidium nitens TaxID=105231 RepID=A0A1Y1IGY2_KLENI|nr:LysM domain containing protein [Klebsormidium nitens]|eukprot:GAQ87986.1 LysM domain containing protein [Klebsormidium nitens]
MPGSIHLAVLDASDISQVAGDGVSIKATLGKKQFVTEVARITAGKAGPWDDEEHAFSVMSLTDPLVLSLLDANGEPLGSTQVTTPSIVEKGFRDETLALKDGKGQIQGRVHVKLSFVLSDEERKKIEAMRSKSLARKGGAAEKSPTADAEVVASPGLNGRRASASRFSFEKAIGNGESTGPAETAAVVAAVGAEVDAQVARASTAALQATADVAKQAKEVAATSEGATASSADKLAHKAAEVSEKAAGVAATAAEGAAGKGSAGNGVAKTKAGEADMLLRRPSVKERVAALESPEARQREADAHRVGKEAEEARRYEAEYREQRQRVEEYKRKEEEKKKEQERQRAAKAAAATRKAEEARQEEQRRAEAAEHGDDDSDEGAPRNMWHQVAGTVAFAVALFFLWPKDSRKRVASRRRVKVSGGRYIVQKGDSLETIVGRMCYNPESDFYKMNPGVCDRNTIYPGQVLRVPEYQ